MVTWKRDIAVAPLPVLREAFLAARGVAAGGAATATDPLLVVRAGAWRAMLAHARSVPLEVGGVLVGEAFVDEDGRLLVEALTAIPALGAVQEAAYFRLTEAAWAHISGERALLHPDLLTVGWYHTHPGLGAFFSGTDRASQRAFFNRPWNVGIVIDPARDEVALFLGAESERLPLGRLVVVPDGGAEADANPGARGDDRAPLATRRAMPERGGRGHVAAAVAGVAAPTPGGAVPVGAAPRRAASTAEPTPAPIAVPWVVLAALAGALLAAARAIRAGARVRRAR